MGFEVGRVDHKPARLTTLARQRSPFLMVKMIPLMTRRSSALGTLCNSRKDGSIQRICASESRNKSNMATPPCAATETIHHLIRKKFRRF